MPARIIAALVCLWTSTVLAQTPGTEGSSPAGDLPAAPPAAGQGQNPTPPKPPVPPPKVELPDPGDSGQDPEAFEPPAGDITLEEWNRDDWLLLKPKHSLIELDGYFRFRSDLFRKLDFDNRTALERDPLAPTNAIARYDGSVVGQGNYNSTNMRLRLEPQINVTDKVQIITTLDILDNLVMGSTPETLPPQGSGTPISILSDSQTPPQNGVNALADSFIIKRAYARLTALNEQLELRFGRMPNHWGLGMMTNDGDCLDCDYGDIADRIAITFRAAGHLFTPMFDWISTGPVITPFGRSGGQPIDALDRDDAVQYSLRIARIDHPEDIRDQVKQGDMVLNYGIWNMIRTQGEELKPSYYAQDPDRPWEPFDPAAPIARGDREENRDGLIYTVNSYGKLFWGNLEVGAELALVYGTYQEQLGNPAVLDKTSVYKLAGVLELDWKLGGDQDGITLNLMAGGASGDSAPGFGALNYSDTQRGPSRASIDRQLNNFQFSPDYHVDLLMFRRIIGTVTDAWYVRPGLTYMFDENFAGKASVIYSQAIFKRSTPGDSRLMGLEIDSEISYGLEGPDPGPFGASIAGGVAIPFGAFDNPSQPEDQESGSFAWTMQARLYLRF